MSNQGNIEIHAWPGQDPIRFTTGRLSGYMSPIAVKRALISSIHYTVGKNVDPHPFMQALIKDVNIAYPISSFGNTDTPTVVVDFGCSTVSFRKEWEDGGKSPLIASWTFGEFIALNLKHEFVIGEWFEGYYDRRPSAQDV